jgi:hypothetical protein
LQPRTTILKDRDKFKNLTLEGARMKLPEWILNLYWHTQYIFAPHNAANLFAQENIQNLLFENMVFGRFLRQALHLGGIKFSQLPTKN